jgi:hypothetical protein
MARSVKPTSISRSNDNHFVKRGAPQFGGAPLHNILQTNEGKMKVGKLSDEIRRYEMKVEIIETLNFPPEIIFGVLTDIPHHVDWVEEPIELVSLSDGPAKLGTKWEQNADRLGKKLVHLSVNSE